MQNYKSKALKKLFIKLYYLSWLSVKYWCTIGCAGVNYYNLSDCDMNPLLMYITENQCVWDYRGIVA